MNDLTPKEMQELEQYAQRHNLSPQRKQELIDNHRHAQQESWRLGVYHPSAGAGKFTGDGMTKIGVE